MKEHSGYQAVRFAVDNGRCPQRAQPVENLSIESPQNTQAAALPDLQCGNHADAEDQNIRDQQRGGDRCASSEKSGKAPIYSLHGEIKVGTALMATRRVDAHQCAAGGTNFRPRLFFAPSKKTTHGVSPAIYTHLPLIGKRHSAPCEPAHRVPIIPKSANLSELCKGWLNVRGRAWTNLRKLGNGSTKNWRACANTWKKKLHPAPSSAPR